MATSVVELFIHVFLGEEGLVLCECKTFFFFGACVYFSNQNNFFPIAEISHLSTGAAVNPAGFARKTLHLDDGIIHACHNSMTNYSKTPFL